MAVQEQLKETYQLTLGSVLMTDQPGPSGLLQTPLEIRVFNGRFSRLYDVSFNKQFIGQDLIDLLSQGCPQYPFTAGGRNLQDRAGILDDLKIVDQPDFRDNPRLLKLHARLGRPWFEFNAYHRKPIFNAIEALNSDEIRGFFAEAAATTFSIDMVVNRMDEVARDLAPKLGFCYYIKTLLAANRAIVAYGAKKDVSPSELTNLPADEIENLILDTPLDIRRQIVQPKLSNHTVHVIDTSQKGQTVTLKRIVNSYPYDYTFDNLGNGQVVIAIQDSSALLELDEEETRILHQHIQPRNQLALKPRLVWVRNNLTGKRKLLTSGLPKQVEESLNPQDNLLLGLVAISALSDKQRHKLPEEHSLHHFQWLARLWPYLTRGNTQTMREAQISLLISMYRNRLSGSHVLDAVEDYMAGLAA